MPEFLISSERQRLISALTDRLPMIRKKLHLSQEELGGMVGKSRQKISDIERKTAPMGWDTYLAVCVSLEHLNAFSEVSDGWYYAAKKVWFE